MKIATSLSTPHFSHYIKVVKKACGMDRLFVRECENRKSHDYVKQNPP